MENLTIKKPRLESPKLEKRQIITAINSGDINLEELSDIIKKLGLSNESEKEKTLTEEEKLKLKMERLNAISSIKGGTAFPKERLENIIGKEEEVENVTEYNDNSDVTTLLKVIIKKLDLLNQNISQNLKYL
jgi:hypothetical protein